MFQKLGSVRYMEIIPVPLKQFLIHTIHTEQKISCFVWIWIRYDLSLSLSLCDLPAVEFLNSIVVGV
jgi:hypothetical protein